jgi:hypothetical protein
MTVTMDGVTRAPLRIDWDALKIIFVCAAVALNSLAKLSPVIYAPLLGAALLILAIDLFRRPLRLEADGVAGGVLLLAYFFFALQAFAMSILTISPMGAMVGLGRFLFAVPILLAFLLYVRDFQTLVAAVVGIAIFMAIGNLSVPWQMMFGEMKWLGSDYMRGGFDRYASVLGNVTAIGISAGFYFAIILILMRPGLWKMLMGLAIVVAAIASLSKAAIFNLAIPVVTLVGLNFFPRFRVFHKFPFRAMTGFTLMVIGVVSIAILVPSVRGRVLVSLASFGVSSQEAVLVDDVDVGTSFHERLFQHPGKVFFNLDRVQGPTGHLTGAGFGMSSTALVPQPDELSIMAHNQLVEFWALGGVFYLLVFLAFLVLVALRLLSLVSHCHRHGLDRQRLFFTCMIVVMVSYGANLPFANGLTYQPTQALIFWLFFALLMLPRSILLKERQAV